MIYLFETLFELWKIRELNYQRIGKRKYLHFDKYIQFSKNIQWFKSYLYASQINIPKHSFYPFIKDDIVTPRLKRITISGTEKERPILTSKIRPIAYASHFDSFIYSWYTTVLSYHYEDILIKSGIDLCVLAYRKKGKNNIHYAKEVFDFTQKLIINEGECVALTFDLSSFFDGIDHAILKDKWCQVLGINNGKLPIDHYSVFKSLTDYCFVKKEEIEIRFPLPLDNSYRLDRICSPKQFRELLVNEFALQKNGFTNNIDGSKRHGTKCGIPQGSPISACLSNIYMLDFDIMLNSETLKRKATYRRYCDDLIVVCKKEDSLFFQDLITSNIKKLELLLNNEKTEIILFKINEDKKILSLSANGTHKNLQYLGFEFNGKDVYIRSSSMSRHHRRMSSKVSKAITDAYSPEFGQRDIIFRKKLLKRFTEKGSRNFISYGAQANRIMTSKSIKNQIKNSTIKLQRLILKESQSTVEKLQAINPGIKLKK